MQRQVNEMLHKIHRLSACLIGVFIAIHLSNHLFALFGIDAHMAAMEVLRNIYRQPVIELLILTCVAFQIISGLIFIKRRWNKRTDFYDRLQAMSGAYLAFFLLNHVGAVLLGRSILDLNTNFYFAAAGLHISPFNYFFVPYYFLAVVAIFCHLACAARWLLRERLSLQARNRLGYTVISVGLVVSCLIMLAFTGALYPVDIPSDYSAPYTSFGGTNR